MHAKLVLAAISLALVAGCATTPATSTAGNGASASRAGLYCWKERLYAQGEGYSCNWESSAAAACTSNGVRTVRKTEMKGTPQPAGMCKTGEWLVMVPTA